MCLNPFQEEKKRQKIINLLGTFHHFFLSFLEFIFRPVLGSQQNQVESSVPIYPQSPLSTLSPE